MKGLPEQVEQCANQVRAVQSHELGDVVSTLIDGAAKNPDLFAMWRTLQRRAIERNVDYDALWVWGFLRTVKLASTHEPYQSHSMESRKADARKLRTLASQFSNLLVTNGLNAHVVRQPKRFSSTWLFYEELSDSNRAQCDESGEPKLSIAGLIDAAAERAATLLETEYYLGKVTKNWAAVSFCRRMVEANEISFGVPLYQAVATAANALYGAQGVNYSEQDVMNLISR